MDSHGLRFIDKTDLSKLTYVSDSVRALFEILCTPYYISSIYYSIICLTYYFQNRSRVKDGDFLEIVTCSVRI